MLCHAFKFFYFINVLDQLWDVEALKCLRNMEGHAARVGALDWNYYIVTRWENRELTKKKKTLKQLDEKETLNIETSLLFYLHWLLPLFIKETSRCICPINISVPSLNAKWTKDSCEMIKLADLWHRQHRHCAINLNWSLLYPL